MYEDQQGYLQEEDCFICGYGIPSGEFIVIPSNSEDDKVVHITCLLNSIPKTREMIFQLQRHLNTMKGA